MFINYIRTIWSQLTNSNKTINTPNRGTYQFDVDDNGKIINKEEERPVGSGLTAC